ncbi:MAG: YceD family protein [Bacteroidales bacterium]|jgi:uncharacterized metal-binding protein YceD (DUF177 family)
MKPTEKLDEFNISLASLDAGKNIFNYSVTQDFMQIFNPDYSKKTDIDITIVLQKRHTLIDVEILGKGSIEVMCNRCAESFIYPINIEEKLIVKYTDVPTEDTVEEKYVRYSSTEINFSKEIYDIIYLAVPMYVVHPDTETGESTCNAETLELLQTYSEKNMPSHWDKLKELIEK